MQDGAPPHFAIIIREWLNAHFPEKWMACDFFLWGLLNEQVYYTTPNILEEYGKQIEEVMFSILQELLMKSFDVIPG